MYVLCALRAAPPHNAISVFGYLARSKFRTEKSDEAKE